MKHEIPAAIPERFIEFVDFVEICPRAGAERLYGFDYGCPGRLARRLRPVRAIVSHGHRGTPEGRTGQAANTPESSPDWTTGEADPGRWQT